MPLKNDRCRFGWFPSYIVLIILTSNASGLRFVFHTVLSVVFGKEFLGRNNSYHLYFVVTSVFSILSTDKVSAVCLSLIIFDRNLSCSLYTYFLAFEGTAPDFDVSVCILHDFT